MSAACISVTDRVEKHQWQEQRWRSTLTPDKLGVVSIKPELLSLKGLTDYIDYLDSNQQDSSKFELAFWRKATQPLTIIAMLLVALSFIFGPLRSVTYGRPYSDGYSRPALRFI